MTARSVEQPDRPNPSPRGVRLVGVSLPDVSDWQQSRPAGKWSGFFGAIARRLTLVEVIRPSLSFRQYAFNLARSFHPRRDTWLGRAGFRTGVADALTDRVEQQLERLDGGYDLIVQLQTLCRPGSPEAGRPYVIYTDSTFALIRRIFPAYAPLPPSRVKEWLSFETDVCQSAAAVFTFSEFVRSSVIDDYGCDPEHVHAIGLGANQFIEQLPDRRSMPPTALFVGVNFGFRKGGPTLLEAWPLVRRRLPDARLVIAGPKGRPPRSLPSGIEWVGHVDRARLEELYTNATVFVLPTMFEGLPYVFIEAMGHGLPCIGSNICAIPEVIEEGVTGSLIARRDVKGLADALLELLGDPQRAARMGAVAHARVLEGMTWAHVAERFVAQLPKLRA